MNKVCLTCYTILNEYIITISKNKLLLLLLLLSTKCLKLIKIYFVLYLNIKQFFEQYKIKLMFYNQYY